MEHKQIATSNGIIHYWIKRATRPYAKCIVFTHGVTADHTMFEKQVNYFQGKYTLLLWDVPLHGLSKPYKDFSYYNTALDLFAILSTENIPKVILVGMSMGGYPSQHFADLYPHMVEGFVALDTTPLGLQYYSKSDLFWLKQVAPMARIFPETILRKSMAKSVSQTKYSYYKMLEILSASTKDNIIEQMKIAYKYFPKENKNVDFKFPLLILLGESDTTGKVSSYCKHWSKETGYELHYIKNAKHYSNGDNPEQVNLEIEAFINGQIP